jgi:hypothetical protein
VRRPRRVGGAVTHADHDEPVDTVHYHGHRHVLVDRVDLDGTDHDRDRAGVCPHDDHYDYDPDAP